MKGTIVLSLALLVAFTNATPLTLDRTNDENDKPMSVVDVPAGVFGSEPKEAVKAEEPIKEVEKAESNPDKDAEVVDERPSLFGFRIPSIVIIRRPAIFDDPWFESPFLGGFNQRPIISRPIDPERESVGEQDTQASEQQKQNETALVQNMFQRMHQQINTLFNSMFNPDMFAMPRPVIPRPVFSRPSFFPAIPEESSEEKLDFDNLPPNYKNSTSETKVVDGHVVTVNKTVQKISGNNTNGFFHFSVIRVRPKDPEANPEVPISNPEGKPSEPQGVITETKPAEMDPQMNEVDRVDDHLQLPEVELKNTYQVNSPEQLSEDEKVEIVPIMSEKLIQAPSGKNKATDLSSDIRVNKLMENSQQGRLRALYDPEEVEVFDV